MKTEFKHLTNREPIEIKDGKLAAGDILPGVQICPVGEWKNGEDEQHCTAEALARIVEAWKQEGEKEILVDFGCLKADSVTLLQLNFISVFRSIRKSSAPHLRTATIDALRSRRLARALVCDFVLK